MHPAVAWRDPAVPGMVAAEWVWLYQGWLYWDWTQMYQDASSWSLDGPGCSRDGPSRDWLHQVLHHLIHPCTKAPSAPPQHNTEPAPGHRVGLLVSVSQSCAQHGQVTATLVTRSAGAIAPALSLCWHPWEHGAPWGFPAWQSRDELQQLSPPLPGLGVGAGSLGRKGDLWGL